MKRLHKPLPFDHTFATPKDLMVALSKYVEKYQTDGPLPLPLVHKAADTYKHLIETSDRPMLVHGDLHHFNVLSSDSRGWRAIDPKGIAAEPLYDVGAMIRNPYEDLKSIPDLKPLVQRRIEILADELQADSKRITQWCFAQTMLSAVWSAEGSKGPSHALRAAIALNDLLPKS
jgi:streptomycin 6-kinase